MLIKFKCNNCDNSITKFFNNITEVPPFLHCGACGIGKLERQLGSPSSKSTQIIDNGIQARRVEVSNEVIEKERKK